MSSPPGLDLDRLRSWLGSGPLRAELVSGGKSNLTYRVADDTDRWVLRRPPLGHVLATAHDMAREHRVQSALADTPVPVPRMDRLCTDESVLGAPFYLMEEVPGTVYRSPADAAGLTPDRARAVSLRLADVLAALHEVDPAAVGLTGFGRPEGYLQRQLTRWQQQLASSRSRELPGVDELQQRLAERLPRTQRTVVVHGDYRLDNTLVGPDDGIAAVLDWEMATLGDPLADLGLMGVYWELAHALPGNPVAGAVDPALGFPRMAELAAHYAARTGLDLAPLPWYTAFAQYKLAVIAEGIHYRYLQGQTVGGGFATLGAMVPPLVAAALDTLAALPR